jgi:predicted RNA binding protein YcfA (HicA-like mRNA interferase family)
VPRKVRELKADLRRAGFTEQRRRAKGSHAYFRHPLIPDGVTIAGSDGSDAQDYQEKQVAAALQKVAAAERKHHEETRP